jgi:predicted transcriptional regulator
MFLSLPIVDVVLPLSSKQLAFFDYGLKYVPPCQSRFSRRSIDEIIEQEYKKLQQRISDNLFNYCMKSSDQRAIEHFASLKQLLQRLYTTSLSRRVAARAQFNHNMVKSIQRRLKQSNIIVRSTDKSKVFYFTSTSDFERKAHQYMTRTNAYQEITSGRCPLADDLNTVTTLLDSLFKNGRITKDQLKQMQPNIHKLELAHLYFIPKTHKVAKE